MDSVQKRLDALELGYSARRPRRIFEDLKQVGDLVYLSGQGPRNKDGELHWIGRLGEDLNVEEGYLAAQQVAVNCLGVLKDYLENLERIEEIVKVLGFVSCVGSFHRQPEVMDGFSSLLIEVLGGRGRHARSAIGASSLPNNQPVEVEMIVRVSE